MPTARIHISAPPERVYALVSNVTRMGEWSPENLGGDWLDGAMGPERGAKFKGRNRRKRAWSTTCTVTAADPGHEFAFDVGKGDTNWSYRFEATDAGTDVTETFTIIKQPNVIGRWLTKVGTGIAWSDREADLVRGMELTLSNLKAEAERAS